MSTQPVAADVLPLPETLTVRNIAEIGEMLRASLSASKSISLDIPDNAEADISFVQLVLAARRSAISNGKSICLKSPPSGSLLDVLSRGGFLESQPADDGDIWTKGTTSQ